MSKHTWEYDERKRVSWSRIESVLSENILKTSSLTISGGEPFDQIEELHRLLKLARQIGYTDILLYTGYTIEELKEKYENKFEEITNLISVLIDGRFVQGLDTDLIWKGSENQRMFIYENNQDIRKTYEEYMTRTKDNKLQLVTFEGVIYIVGILRQK
uniref:4Fe-4S cluster-binding domain-containing protein n=1 Tax=Fervidobacterium pennivorans TaxID=93466 RepID=A0A7C4VW17_FERPE